MPITPRTSIPVDSRPTLARLDTNGDKVVDRSDLAHLNDDEARGVLYSLDVMTQKVAGEVPDAFSLAGKSVVFSALQNLSKSEAKERARAEGATPRTSLSSRTEILVVGDRDRTTKDEKAFQMNASGRASIMLMSESAFIKASSQDVFGSAPYVSLENYGDVGEEHVKVSQAIVDKADAAVDAFSLEYIEDSGIDEEEAEWLLDTLSAVENVAVDDEVFRFEAYYGAGALIVELDRNTLELVDAWEQS